MDALYDISVAHLLHYAPIGTALRSGEHKQLRLRKDEVFNEQRLPRAWGPAQDQGPVGLTHVVLEPRLHYGVRVPNLGLLRGGRVAWDAPDGGGTPRVGLREGSSCCTHH